MYIQGREVEVDAPFHSKQPCCFAEIAAAQGRQIDKMEDCTLDLVLSLLRACKAGHDDFSSRDIRKHINVDWWTYLEGIQASDVVLRQS